MSPLGALDEGAPGNWSRAAPASASGFEADVWRSQATYTRCPPSVNDAPPTAIGIKVSNGCLPAMQSRRSCRSPTGRGAWPRGIAKELARKTLTSESC